MKKLLYLSLLLVGCQQNQFPLLPYQNPELMPVVDVIMHEGQVRGLYYSVEDIGFDYKALEYPRVAQCAISLNGKFISVDPTFWMYNEARREQTMAHEIGHCLLRRPHLDGYENGHNISVMSTYLFSSQEFYSHRDYFYDELFLR